jgi:hypothetical protein
MATHPALPGKHLSHPAKPAHPPRKGGDGSHRTLLFAGAALVVVIALVAVMMMLRPKGTAGTTVASPEAFVEQLERAAEGTVFDKTVYGGPMRSEIKGNQLVITADGVPPGICVSVGWKLVRKGLLSINGVTPVRVSAAKLSELCYQDENSATLTWAPKATQ